MQYSGGVRARPNQLRQRKHVLAMRNRGEQVLLQPLAVGEHTLLMTARAGVASLAAVSRQVVVTTLIAVDATESLMQVATGEEALKYLSFYRLREICVNELCTVLHGDAT